MNRFKSKKGFTLAELLIVVAIIAVLIAIAVPIFFGALDNAKEGVFKANTRTLKGLAVSQILTDQKALDKDENGDGVWTATGYWEKDGTIHLVTVADGTKGSSTDTPYADFKELDAEEFAAGTSTVTVVITKADVDANYVG